MPLMSARRSFVSIACLCGLACSDPVITAPAIPPTSPNAARGSADDYTFVLMDPNPDVLDASGSAFAVNNRGQATGQGGRFAYGFVWTERSGMQSLGTLDNASAGQDVNEQGVIVGFVSMFGVPPGNAGRSPRAAIWTPETGWRVIGSLATGTNSGAQAVNNRGTVVGSASEVGGAFLWTEQDGMVGLGTLPGLTGSSASDVNEREDVVGTAGSGSSARAFIWSAGDGMRALTAPGWPQSFATGINARGWVVGRVEGPSGGQAALWTSDGDLELLGTLGGTTASATGINDRGEVVGSSRLADGRTVPFLWTRNTGMVALPLPPDATAGSANDINARGDIVGSVTLTRFPYLSRNAAVAWLR